MTHRSSLRRRLSAVAILGVLAGALAASGPAQALTPTPVFAPPLTYEAGNAGGLVIADFTGDGRNDVLVRGTDTSATERPDRLYLFGQAQTVTSLARTSSTSTHCGSTAPGSPPATSTATA